LGLARFQAGLAPGGELTGAGQIMGTADYIAPEQVSDSRNVDIRADIYSLGCTLYKLLAGDTVFSGSQYTGLYEILMAHVLKSPMPIRQVRSEVPESLAAVTHRMLAKQPADRFSTPAHAAEALAPFAAGHNLVELWRRSAAKAKSSATTDRPVLATAESYSASPGTTTRALRPAELTAVEETQPPDSDSLRVLASTRRSKVVARIVIVGVLCMVVGVLTLSRIIPFGEKRQEPVAQAPVDVPAVAKAPAEPPPKPPEEKAPVPKTAAPTPNPPAKAEMAKTSQQSVKPPAKPPVTPQAESKPQTKRPAKPRPGPRVPAPPLAVSPFDGPAAVKHQEAWAKHLGIPATQSNSIGMKLVLIPAGEFEMGTASTAAETPGKKAGGSKATPRARDQFSSEGPPHRVKISRPFYLGAYEVTQAEFQGVMGVNPSHFAPRGDGRQKADRQETARHPVESVSWHEAVEFCRKLSEFAAERSAGRSYRLPTEAEWEYACRAGTTSPWFCGDHDAALGDYAWLRPLSGEVTHPVGQKKPNAWGLYDIHGNVFEWCSDWFSSDYYAELASLDPTGPPSGLERVIRGGSWWNLPKDCRSAARVGSPADGSNMIGFRVACDLGEPND
jgi:formylglycine-generating enzyme required for sulfatase activity